MIDVRVAGDEFQRCGFPRCREPLPPPGPKGGRPYEFCPERTWPGGKSCKQLAAAEQALRDALGDTVDAAALQDATVRFAEQAERVTPQLTELALTVQTVRDRLESELGDAAARADRADTQAAEDRGRREQAEQQAARAEEARQEAVAAAERHAADRAAAEQERRDADARARAAELEQARAETAAREQRERAEAAEARADSDRARAEHAERTAAGLRQDYAASEAQREATDTALLETREELHRVRQRADEHAEQLRSEARADREQLARAQHRLHEEQNAHQHQVEALREQLGEARARADARSDDLTAARATFELVRTAVSGDHDGEWLRRRVSAALDGHDPEQVPAPQPAEDAPPEPADTDRQS